MTPALPPPGPAVASAPSCGQTLTLKAAPHLKAGTKTARTCIYPASRQKLVFVLKYAGHPAQTPRVLASTLALTGAPGQILSVTQLTYTMLRYFRSRCPFKISNAAPVIQTQSC